MDRPLGAQISHMLNARGVSHIFGIPGVHNVELYRGIEEAGITHTLARHEQGAGFMADGYARATGRPGVAYVITGPGICNIMTPMGQAYSDSVPMLVVSSCLNRAELGMNRGELHEMKNQEIAAETVCDWSRTAMDAASAYELVDRALIEFQTSRARPKHIQIPIEVLGQPVPPAPPAFVPVDVGEDSYGRSMEVALDMMTAARRPMFLFGGGAAAGWEDARRVTAMLGAASFTSYAGCGIIADDDPLHFGSYLARPGAADILAEADLMILVGTELAHVDRWRDHPGHDCPAIHVDIDPQKLARGGPGDQRFHTRAENWLATLADKLSAHVADTDWSTADVERTKRRWKAEVEAETPPLTTICDALHAALPDDTVIYSDMTQLAYTAKEVYPLNRPGLWHHPNGFGTLGYALPAAIGGKIGLGPDRPVIAIAGDYGFHYTMQELGVAVELELCLPIILWDNAKLGAIERSMIESQIAPNAVIARNPDFQKLAEAFGARAVAPATLNDFQRDMTTALNHKGPTLIYLTPDIV